MKRAAVVFVVGLIAVGIILFIRGFWIGNAAPPSNVATQDILSSTPGGNVTWTPNPKLATEMKRIESALLLPPDQCKSPCFWDFQPGKDTGDDFKRLALAIFKDSLKDYAAPERKLEGIDINGIALHISPSANSTSNKVVDYISVGVNPQLARSSSLNFDSFALTSIINTFGTPDDAILLYSPQAMKHYSLLLLYSTKNVVYEMRSSFQDGGCIST